MNINISKNTTDVNLFITKNIVVTTKNGTKKI